MSRVPKVRVRKPGGSDPARKRVRVRAPRAARPAKKVRRISLRRRRIVWRSVTWAAVVAITVITLWLVAGWAEADETCAGCHTQTRPSTPAHGEASCVDCHRQGGVTGALQHGASYTRMLREGYVFKEEPVAQGTQPESSACLRCHKGVFDESFDETRSVRIDHRHLHKAGYACLDCHEGLGHRETVAERPRSVMEKCLACHDGQQAASECENCHRQEPSDVASEWREAQPVAIGMQDSCSGCHDVKLAQECVDCHGGYEMPHPVGWVEGDHMYGGFTDQADCLSCHAAPVGVEPAPHGAPTGGYGGGFCNRCHSYPSPHGDNATWIRMHGPASRGAYVSGQYCSGCHGVGGVAEQQCNNCHSEATCAKCHEERDRHR
jgi:nitrate/TMAO reductase-like tetraheme cytochrome c subunit